MFTNLSAVQINRLAQRLSDAPLGRSASVAAAAERFERLLAAKIGADRAPKAIKAILTAPGFETAAGRLAAELDACEPDAPAERTGAAPVRAGTGPRTCPDCRGRTRRRAQRPASPPGCRHRSQGPAGRTAPAARFLRTDPCSVSREAGRAGGTGREGRRNRPARHFDQPRLVQPQGAGPHRDLAVLAIEAREGRA